MLFLWVAYVVVEAFAHYYLIEEKNTKPIYLIVFLLRGMAAIGHGALCDVQSVSDWWPLLLFQISSHLVLFPKLLNLFRGKDFWYVGKESGWIDSVIIKIPIVGILLYVIGFLMVVYSLSILL